jgi:hypothetical protein
VALTPLTSAWVWLESNLLSGTVITQVTSKQTIATFGDGVDTISLKYSRAKGCFVPSTVAGAFTKSKNVMLYNPLAPEEQGAIEEFRELVSRN